jgi:DNA-binding transcriptional MerR regulator
MLIKTLDIGEVVKRVGLPASTLRYYEEKGLIKSVGRHGLRRMFDVSVLHRLSLISLGRLAGMSLEEINMMLSSDGIAKIDRQQLSNKADELEQKIMHLSAMRDGLRHAANCPEPSHFECPKFNQLLRVANRQVRVLNKKS